MKTSIFKRGVSVFMAMLMCLSALVGIGTTTAFAAGTESEVYMISFPRDGDANYGGTWGHRNLQYMNGWSSGESNHTTVRAMGTFESNICYCIEPGVPLNIGDKLTDWDENFWDNYPSSYNHTIAPDDIKLFIGRIMQYGYTGTISTDWRSQNEGADKLAHAVATQLLIWETVVGERDADFNKVSTGGYDAVLDQVSADHPLRSQIMRYYNSIASSVQTHSKLPSFLSRSAGRAQNIELEWDGEKYTATLTDTNNVLSNYSFQANKAGIRFSVSGNKLTITADEAPSGTVSITASKNNSNRRGVITWSDGRFGPDGSLQDVVTYAQSVSDPITGYLNIKVSYGSAKIVKTSEDGKVEGITFRIQGNGIDKTVTTGAGGEVQIDNLTPGTYTVTEQAYDKYEPQESRQVVVVSGRTATVTFNNILRRGDLVVTKTAEDGLTEGIKFHLSGTSLSGIAVDEYAVTDSTGKAYFNDVLIGSGYVLEEVDTPIRYVVPDNQSAAVERNKVTQKSFDNRLKKWNATVTKSDSETGSAQGDASLAGAVYGVYDGDELIDTYGLGIGVYFSSRRNYRRREEHGSAKWGDAGAIGRKYRAKQYADNKIFTQNVRMGLDVRRHRRQLNSIIVGGSGAGKTRFFAKPNLYQANTSFVVLDPKGELARDAGALLEAKGYEVRVLDLLNMEKSFCYNPFVYLRDDNDVQRLVTNLFKSTTPKGSQSQDPFWDTAASMLLLSLVFYLKYEAPPDEQNFPMVMEMLRAADVREDDDSYQSPLDELFERLEMRDPEHIAVKYYKDYHSGSAKTLKSIQITLAARLEKFNLSSLAALTATDELDLPSLGEKKVALFALIPDNDTSFNFLVSILYTQLFQQLFWLADHKYGGALPVPVHFLMDEFANVSLPDDFDKILAVMRSRNVSVSIILQNIAQLKALFEKQWESIIGNCDEFLYLGGNEQSTHKYVSELLGKETIDMNTYGQSRGHSGSYSTNWQLSGRELLDAAEVRMLDNRYALLFIRGERPILDEKYDILKHPNVALSADGKAKPYEHGKTDNAVASISFAGVSTEELPEGELPETDYELLSDEEIEALFL